MAQFILQSSLVKDIIIGTSLCLLIFTSSISLPLIGFFIILFLPFPVLFYRLKLGRNFGSLIMVASLVIIISVTKGLPVDILFCGSLLGIGLLLGEFIERNFSIEKISLYTCTVIFGICFSVIIVYSTFIEQGFIQLIAGYISKNIELTLKLYEELGIEKDQVDLLAGSLNKIQFVLIRLLPAIIIIMLMFINWLNILLIKIFLNKKKIKVKCLEKLNHWTAPGFLIWISILMLASIFIPSKAVKFIGFNSLMILMLIYFFQGIAVVSFFFEKKGFPFLLRLLFYTVIAIQQIFLLIVIILGFSDHWADFRKLETLSNSQNKTSP